MFMTPMTHAFRGVSHAIAVLFVLLIVSCAPGPSKEYGTILSSVRPSTKAFDPAVLRKMEQRIETTLSREIAPGAVLLVANNGSILNERAFGFRRLEPQREPMTLDTIFDLASLSKVFGTATSTLVLLEDGKLNLDDRVAQYIPEFAAEGKDDVRVFHLLTHSSGLKAYDDWKAAEKDRGNLTQADALIRRISSLPKLYPTGQYSVYSCLNYLTLARVNEVAAGESQHNLLRRRVWEPLGMKDTGYLLSREQLARCAPTAQKSDGTRMVGETHDPLANYYQSTARHCPGNAGLFSTARDLSIFCQMLLNEGVYGERRVFKPETVRMMTSEQSVLPTYDVKTQGPGGNSRRGLGWIVYLDTPYNNPAAPDGSFIGHTGYTGTYAWIDKNSRSFIVYLANAVYSKDPPQINDSRREITGAFLEGIYPPPR